jgi:cob(I)alamin adenosyltransferase
VILDELTYLCTWGWIDTAAVVAALRDRPDNVNVIVTGRDCPAEIVEIADTVTEMRKIKHAYDQGIAAKKGIEY